MAVLRPLAPDASGIPKQITAPDTIDPSILPATGSVPVSIAAGATFTVPTNTQVLYAVPIVVDGSLICDGEKVWVGG